MQKLKKCVWKWVNEWLGRVVRDDVGNNVGSDQIMPRFMGHDKQFGFYSEFDN